MGTSLSGPAEKSRQWVHITRNSVRTELRTSRSGSAVDPLEILKGDGFPARLGNTGNPDDTQSAFRKVDIMLNRVRVQNFKCLRDVDVELGPFTVLIGPNDSGKSSFLSALQLLGKLACSDIKRGYAASEVANVLRENDWICRAGTAPTDSERINSSGSSASALIETVTSRLNLQAFSRRTFATSLAA